MRNLGRYLWGEISEICVVQLLLCSLWMVAIIVFGVVLLQYWKHLVAFRCEEGT
jgi:hypothetical protein